MTNTLELAKVLFEAHGQVPVAAVIFLFIVPGGGWLQHFVGDARAVLGDFEAEDRITFIGHVVELSA